MSHDRPGELYGERLRGIVSSVVYRSHDSGWGVVRLETGEGEATVVGHLAPIFEGQAIRVEGEWEDDPRYGRQFRARTVRMERPDDADGIERYLASGVVPGIGPELARRLVERFGSGTMEVIDERPERLTEVEGIGPKRLRTIRESWEQQTAERDAMVFLQGHGLGPALARRVVQALGPEVEEQVRGDPYRLADVVSGIGFRTADALARQIGWERDAVPRAAAGIRHVLQDALDDGDCFVPYVDLIERARRVLELEDDEVVRRAAAEQIRDGALVAEPLADEEADRLGVRGAEAESPRAVYLKGVYAAERRTAGRLGRLYACRARSGLRGDGAAARRRRAVDWVQGQLGVELGDGQRRVVRAALEEVVLLVTGGPGTGKTTLIDAIVRCFEALEARVELAAPTGRAAKRLSQATGRSARTIHRLLEYTYEVGFTRGPDHPLDADLVIVDEASMVDLFLMDALVAAVPEGCRLILVGDADQLPPVGPGATLRDLLQSGALPKVRLTEIFRQARRSMIVRNAHRVNGGEMPRGGEAEAGPGSGSDAMERDFFIVGRGDPVDAREVVVRLVTRRIPERFGFDPRDDVQVLSPMHRGECGVTRLNAVLQERLNPDGEEYEAGESTLRVGDRVIQGRNDYEREVFNGDVGRVAAVADDGLTVAFEGRAVKYSVEAVRDLSLAYAITVHKSQGSEYPAVVTVLLPEHYIMLQRNLLYTALTRARSLAVLVATSRVIGRAVRNDAPAARFTRLAPRVAEAVAQATRQGRIEP